jgi:phage tail sheath protein FI
VPEYLAPGIFVEEIASGANPIQPVGTSTAAFLGRAPDEDALKDQAVPVDNWSQFLKLYWKEGAKSTPLSNAVHGFFYNGGRRCYVVNLGASEALTGGGKTRTGLDLLEAVDEVAIVAAPGFTSAVHYAALVTHCENQRDRIAILDPPETFKSVDQLTKVATATASPRRSARRSALDSGDQPPDGTGLRPADSKFGFGAFYVPWITIADPLSPTELVDTPPSGHIAGVYARTDAQRGVFKAPANERLNGAVNVNRSLSRADQETLNPAGVNCIRLFAREGVLVWGARTIGPGEWRYVPVRRLFSMVEKSIAQSTRWIVFEPNDRTLWKSIVRDVRAFLLMLWREGALMGKTEDEAFFVQCDEETNPPESIDLGLVVTRVGLAPVKPAEFVVFRIGQSIGGTEVTEQEGAANA